MIEKLFKTLPSVKILSAKGNYAPIDLSVKNQEIENLLNPRQFENYIDKFLSDANAEIAYGGYQEKRNLYKRSGMFNEASVRDIHIGLDLWTKAGTAVLAALDGKVHSFAYNAGLGNYGSTIILEHQHEEVLFYTLYGHLSIDSIETLEIGERVSAGEKIAALGDASVNGDYAPHLHFQIIFDLEGKTGDYPGVCAEDELKYYANNCPDPNLLLKLNRL